MSVSRTATARTGAFAATMMLLCGAASPAMATLGATDDGAWLAAEGCARPAVVINSIKLTSTDLVSSATVANLRLGDYLCIEADGRSVAGQGAYEKVAHTKDGTQGVVDSSAIVESPQIVLSAADFTHGITVWVEPSQQSFSVVSALAKASRTLMQVPAAHPLVGDDPTLAQLSDGQKLLVDDSISVTATDGMYGSAIWHPARTADGTVGWVNEAILTSTNPSSASASPSPSASATAPSPSASGESLWDKLKEKGSDSLDAAKEKLSDATTSDSPSTWTRLTSTPAVLVGILAAGLGLFGAASSLGRRRGESTVVKSGLALLSAVLVTVSAAILPTSLLPSWGFLVLFAVVGISATALWSSTLRYRDARPSFRNLASALHRPIPLVALVGAAASSLFLLAFGVTAWAAYVTMSLLALTLATAFISSGQTEHDTSGQTTPTSDTPTTEPSTTPQPDPRPTTPADEPTTPEPQPAAESEAHDE